MSGLVRELSFALRGFINNPGFTAVALSILGLAIGANTAIVSVVHGVLLRPLPFRDPSRLVSLWELAPDDAGVPHRFRVTAGNYADWRDQSNELQSIAMFGAAGFNWTGEGEPEQLLGGRVTASYFEVLDIAPLLGRTFTAEDNEPGRSRVLLLSQGLWRRRFGASPDVLGKNLDLDGEPYEIVGVMPEAVYPTWPQATGRLPFLPLYQQFWVPLALSGERSEDRRSHLFGVIGRLRDGATLDSARAEMRTIAVRLETAYPDANEGESITVVPYLDEVVGGVRPALLVLLGAVGLVLVIACANIASLLLARAVSRQKEMAVRSALGAGRLALMRQLLAESLVLATLGGLLGLGLARLGVSVLVALSPAEIPRLSESGLSAPVLAFSLLLTLATALLFGLAPALQLSRTNLRGQLGARPPRLALRRALVVAELAVAVVLVVGASLLLQSFVRLRGVDPGFSAANVLVTDLTLPSGKYQDFRSIARMHQAVLDRLGSFSNVQGAALAYDHPLESNWIDSFRIDGDPERDESKGAAFRIVSPDYFRTVGIGLVEGRAFEELDDPDHPGATIVNEAFVKRYFPDGTALGKKLVTTTPSFVWGNDVPRLFEVVGVVKNVRFLGPAEPAEPAFYVPAAQFPVQEMTIFVRTDGDPASFAPRLREEVWGLDPDLPLSNTTTMERLLSESLAQPRFNASVVGFFGATALFLAALGMYGLLASSVAQRTSEIGIRMALGAGARDVSTLFVRQGMELVLAGVGIGVVAALASTRLLGSLLFGVEASDPPTFVTVVLFLAGVALLSCYLPARRAARLNPLLTLRRE